MTTKIERTGRTGFSINVEGNGGGGIGRILPCQSGEQAGFRFLHSPPCFCPQPTPRSQIKLHSKGSTTTASGAAMAAHTAEITEVPLDDLSPIISSTDHRASPPNRLNLFQQDTMVGNGGPALTKHSHTEQVMMVSRAMAGVSKFASLLVPPFQMHTLKTKLQKYQVGKMQRSCQNTSPPPATTSFCFIELRRQGIPTDRAGAGRASVRGMHHCDQVTAFLSCWLVRRALGPVPIPDSIRLKMQFRRRFPFPGYATHPEQE